MTCPKCNKDLSRDKTDYSYDDMGIKVCVFKSGHVLEGDGLAMKVVVCPEAKA